MRQQKGAWRDPNSASALSARRGKLVIKLIFGPANSGRYIAKLESTPKLNRRPIEQHSSAPGRPIPAWRDSSKYR